MSEKITKYVCTEYVEYKNENNQRHNINDKPAVIWEDGSKQWYRNNKLHRTKGPAAIRCSDGYEYWYYENKNITDKVNQLMEDGKINPDWRNWAEEDEFLFVLLVS